MGEGFKIPGGTLIPSTGAGAGGGAGCLLVLLVLGVIADNASKDSKQKELDRLRPEFTELAEHAPGVRSQRDQALASQITGVWKLEKDEKDQGHIKFTGDSVFFFDPGHERPTVGRWLTHDGQL